MTHGLYSGVGGAYRSGLCHLILIDQTRIISYALTSGPVETAGL